MRGEGQRVGRGDWMLRRETCNKLDERALWIATEMDGKVVV